MALMSTLSTWDEAQLAYRLGHVAAAFVAGAAALGHADGGPELLIKAELTADFAGSIFSMVSWSDLHTPT